MAGIPILRILLVQDAVRVVEDAVVKAFDGEVPEGLVLRTDNGPQYNAQQFRRKFLNDQSFREGYTRKLEVKLNEK